MRHVRLALASLGILVVIGATGGCCPESPDKSITSKQTAEESKPPTPGPIIIIRPGTPGNGYTATWSVAGTPVDPANNTEAGRLRLDAFGGATTFRIVKQDGSSMDLSTLSFRIADDGHSNTIQIRKNGDGVFVWKINNETPQICDRGVATCMSDCENADGLPAEFFGKISLVNAPTGIAVSDIKEIRIRADYTNPCP